MQDLTKQIVDEIESLTMVAKDAEHAEEFAKYGYKDTIRLLRALLPLIEGVSA